MKTGTPRIAFITRRSSNCGVADYGKRLYAIMAAGMDIDLKEVDESCEVDLSGYDVSLYNYHYATLPYVSADDRTVKHVALFHEAHMNFTPDVTVSVQDLPRLLFNFTAPPPENAIPVIGSFGFGFPDKDFPGLCQKVRDQFSEAIVRLHIPFAEFGDSNGHSARSEAQKCRQVLAGSNIQLQVSHDFKTYNELLNWLSCNDINAFNYAPSHGRGISSATDYAVSCGRPVAINDSEMFRHLPRELMGNLPGLIDGGNDCLQGFREENSHERLVEAILKAIS